MRAKHTEFMFLKHRALPRIHTLELVQNYMSVIGSIGFVMLSFEQAVAYTEVLENARLDFLNIICSRAASDIAKFNDAEANGIELKGTARLEVIKKADDVLRKEYREIGATCAHAACVCKRHTITVVPHAGLPMAPGYEMPSRGPQASSFCWPTCKKQPTARPITTVDYNGQEKRSTLITATKSSSGCPSGEHSCSTTTSWCQVCPMRAFPCNLRREGGHSLVILEGKEGIPL